MKVCDKCRRTFQDEREVISCNLGNKNYELCDICSNKVATFIEVPQRKGFFNLLQG